MHVLVLSGGTSNERDISLRSGQAVAAALQIKGHTVAMHDPRDGLEALDRPDVIFPALHGAGGEDGAVQAELDKQGLSYVGTGSAASALCFDKWVYRQKLVEAGFPLANGTLVSPETMWRIPFSAKPFVLKPVMGGSSIDTFIVRDISALSKATRQAIHDSLQRYGEMLLEELIGGSELTIGILGDQALPVIEIIPPQEGEFDYENKYNGKTQELCPPVHISEAIQKQAQELALQVHQLVGCRHLSRTDMIVTPTEQLVILETNTLPGMTDQSLFPKAAAAAGFAMPELVDRLVHMAAK